MSKLIEHAKREFLIAGYKPIEQDVDGPNKWIQENILELLHVFEKQGHSGSSAPYCIAWFNKLANFEPICPLTGEDAEWQAVDENLFQNKRCSNVFKNVNGQAYNIDGKVFIDKDGAAYTSKESLVYITFPYTPKTEYVKDYE